MAGAAVALASSALQSIFGGMAARAKEATNENLALQQVIQGFDQAIQQINASYNNGNLGQADAIAQTNNVWNFYWQTMTPRIQPNRDGCASGQNCPNAATSNGEPAGYCSGDIGATCCVGCGPFRQAINNILAVLKSGSGTAVIPTIYGNKYGVQTRQQYSLTFNAPPVAPVAAVQSAANSVLSSLGLTTAQSVVGPTGSSVTVGGSGSVSATTLLIGGAVVFGILLIAIARK